MATKTKKPVLRAAANAVVSTLLAVTINLATEWKSSPWSWTCVAGLTFAVFLLSIRTIGNNKGDEEQAANSQQNTAYGAASVNAVQNGDQTIYRKNPQGRSH